MRCRSFAWLKRSAAVPAAARPPCRHWPIFPHVPIAVVPAARGTRAVGQKTTPRIAGFYGARLSQPQHVARQTSIEIIPNRFLPFHPLRARHPFSGKNARRRCSRCCCAWDTRAPSETQAAILVPETGAAPRPFSRLAHERCLHRIVFDVTPGL